MVAGTGWCRATAVGADAYAAHLSAQARRFTLTRSDLQAGINRILRWVGVAMVPASLLLLRGQYASGLPWREAAQRAVAGVVNMVPEGLVLLTSIAFAVGVVRLGRRNCLVKELPAVEGLARVSVVCLDKTGTLTDGQISLRSVSPLNGYSADEVDSALAALVAADPSPNPTLAAIGLGVGAALARAAESGQLTPPPAWQATDRMPFSSARKWSGATFENGSTWLVGAPEMLLPAGHPTLAVAAEQAATGQRVLDALRELVERAAPVGLHLAGQGLDARLQCVQPALDCGPQVANARFELADAQAALTLVFPEQQIADLLHLLVGWITDRKNSVLVDPWHGRRSRV